MSNLTTFQSRAYAAFVFIDGDVRRFKFDMNGVNYTHLISGIMFLISLIIFLGKIANSGQMAMMSDLMQAAIFGGKVLVVVLKAVVWGVFG